MTLDEVYEDNPMISRRRAVVELERHDADVSEFFEELGRHEEYSSRDVLNWLGY